MKAVAVREDGPTEYYNFGCDVCDAKRHFAADNGWRWVPDPERVTCRVSLCPACQALDWRRLLIKKRRRWSDLNQVKRRIADEQQ